MLTVLIETHNSEEALARTLASLIGAAVEGVVREVIVCDRGSTDHTNKVADQAGCHFLADGGVAAGVRQAKSDWLLLIEPGARLVEGWTEEVLEHIGRTTRPARFSRARADRTRFLARVFSTRRALAEGLVVSKMRAAALCKSAGGAEALARGLATKRLAAEIRIAPPV